MPKTQDQIRSEIISGLQSQSINMLIESLAAANLKIAELEDKLQSLEKKDE